MAKLVAFGDLHMYRLGLWPHEWLSKRLLGQTNLWLNRRRKFKPALLSKLVSKFADEGADGLVLTGDLTTTALGREFEDAWTALKPLRSRLPTFVVQGNHDRYTWLAQKSRLFEQMCAGAMMPRQDGTALLPVPGSRRWRILLLDVCQMRPFDAVGKVREQTLARVKSLVGSLDSDQGLVVVGHYPLLHPQGMGFSASHDLQGREELRDVLAAVDAEVVMIHGHIHRPWHIAKGEACEGGINGVAPFVSIDLGAPVMCGACGGSDYPLGQGAAVISLPEEKGAPVTVRRVCLEK